MVVYINGITHDLKSVFSGSMETYEELASIAGFNGPIEQPLMIIRAPIGQFELKPGESTMMSCGMVISISNTNKA